MSRGSSHPQGSWCNFLSDLSMKSHVLTVTVKANKILGLLKPTFENSSEAMISGYQAVVRLTIEYACPVWDPYQAYLSDKLESIQLKVSRWILGNDLEYAERLKSLCWMEMRFRREFLSLLQLFKFINGLSKIELDKYLTFSSSNTRSCNNLKIFKPSEKKHFELFLLEALHRYMELAAQFSGWRSVIKEFQKEIDHDYI